MDKKLYVGGINYRTTDDGLRDAFAQAGEVLSAQILMDKMTGRSRGFGFVEMATPEGAQAAIDMWNDKELEGRKLIVNVAKPMEKRERPMGGGGMGGGNRGGFGGRY
jgi:RNA recognition motif-containing protein